MLRIPKNLPPFAAPKKERIIMAKKELMAAIRKYYDGEGWHYEYKPERNLIEMFISLGEINTCRVLTFVRDDRFVTYTVFPLRPVEKMRAKVGEYLHGVNYGLSNGNFEFDYNDGEIRYKANNLLCGNTIPSQKDLGRIIEVGMDMISQYGGGLLRVMYGGADPQEVLDEIEKKAESMIHGDIDEREVDEMLGRMLSAQEGRGDEKSSEFIERIRALGAQAAAAARKEEEDELADEDEDEEETNDVQEPPFEVDEEELPFGGPVLSERMRRAMREEGGLEREIERARELRKKMEEAMVARSAGLIEEPEKKEEAAQAPGFSGDDIRARLAEYHRRKAAEAAAAASSILDDEEDEA